MTLGMITHWRSRLGMRRRREHELPVSLRNAVQKVWGKRFPDPTSVNVFSAQIVSQMDSAVIAVDLNAITTMLNPAALTLFNMHDHCLIGKPIQQVLPQSLADPLLHTLATQQRCQRREMTLHLTGERVLPIAYSSGLLHDNADRLCGALLLIYDLSQVLEGAAEKHRTERFTTMESLVKGIAHEIKNPLVAIKALAELLPEQYDDAEFRETFSQVALFEVERIDALVQRLRNFDIAPPSQMRRMSILAPLEETLALLSGELTSRQMTVSFDHDGAVPSILGDHDQLKQVFLNICLNSIEAMHAGGTLSIELSTPSTHVTGNELVQVCIADTGPGFSHEDRVQIFEPFVTTKQHGSGLGLAICKAIIRHHGGTISAKNNSQGAGAHFIVRLPVAHEEDAYEVVTPRCRSARTVDTIT